MNMLQMLGVNGLLGLVFWGMYQDTRTPMGFAVGFVVGFIVLSIVQREYGRRTAAFFAFLGYMVWTIVRSALEVAWIIIGPREVRPGIIAVPLRSRTVIEVLLLATSITVPPGTISVETGSTADGRPVLFVHALLLEDPDALRHSIQQNLERRILRFTRSLDWEEE